ncbi:metal-dependent transcriptional regulator [Agilicoccus flavus]|uniref:metal-dependent transcriptional regulator n=1 Tax=Agilicoccus flavus TaxID=2775968 RepID=UPI001CF668F9|nr:metal-dependent transcriptional regulator [Agilicoccus flavus]
MTDLIDTTEMYLRTFLELEEEGIPLLRARIAERLGHSGPTVSQTVARMERDDLVQVQEDRHVVLLPEGRARAVRVMRKHRLAERLLVDVIGLEYEYVHDEACRWEHVMSERVERKILAMLTEHGLSPYGNPIPGLEELGETSLPFTPGDTMHLTSVEDPSSERVVLRRIGEELQGEPDILAGVHAAGVVPGAELVVRRDGTTYVVRAADAAESDAAYLPPDLAAHLFVTTGA